MIVKLTPCEGGATCFLDKATIKRLDVGPDGLVELIEHRGVLIITTPAKLEEKGLERLLKEIDDEFGDVLQRLAN
jgi:hypothetical protein